MTTRFLARTLPAIAATAVATSAAAAPDPKILPKEDEVKKDAPPALESAWDPSLVFGLNIALATSNDVVGQADGLSVTGGLNIAAGLNYLREAIDWRNALKISEIYTRTPVIDEFVKSGDQLTFESTFYYRASETVGPFATFKLDTSLLEGRDVRAAAVDYKLDGADLATAKTSVHLTDGFQPMSLKEAIGVFVSPITKDELDVDIRAGFGAIETFADGGRVVSDDGATPAIELVTLKDVTQAGAVIGAEMKGVLDDKRVLYSAHAEVLFPLINDDPDERNAWELANVDIGAKLGFKLFKFASLDYEIKVARQPQLIDAWQISNSLLLNFAYAFIE